MTSSVAANSIVYFVTGGSRGIGYGIVALLAARSNSLVYATARDVTKADKLQQLAKQHSNIRMVQLKADSEADHAAAAKQVQAEAGRVDVLLAVAGISNVDAYEPSEQVTIDKLREHFEVNTVGPVRLFKAFFPLLSRSSAPKFVVISTISASIGDQYKMTALLSTNYGASKAAINYVAQRIHLEHPNITTFPVHPGWVQTEMGNAGAKHVGMKEAPMTVAQSVAGIVKLVDESTRDTHSGKFWSAEDNTQLPW